MAASTPDQQPHDLTSSPSDRSWTHGPLRFALVVIAVTAAGLAAIARHRSLHGARFLEGTYLDAPLRAPEHLGSPRSTERYTVPFALSPGSDSLKVRFETAVFDRDARAIQEQLASSPTADAPRLRQQMQVQIAKRNELLMKAIPLYEETIKRAREYGVANAWTKKALERMNIYKPDQYPLLHDPALDLQVEDRRR